MNPPAPLQLKSGVDYNPAPFLIRIAAYVMDLAASIVITVALYRFVGLFLHSLLSGNPFLANTFSQSMFFLGGFGYWVAIPLFSGATPAKMLFHMRVVPESNIPISPVQIILREVIGHILNAVTLGIGFLIALRDKQQRGLNDRLAKTRLIRFTSPHPELYRVQDLCTVDRDGTLQSEAAGKFLQPEEPPPISDESPEQIEQPHEPPLDTGEDEPAQKPVSQTITVSQSLYSRPGSETAYERKLRAARGPTVKELSAAIRRTAEMVEEGQLTQKVLDRKREDFVEKIGAAELGDPPDDAVREIVDLGKTGILTHKELTDVLEILRERLRGQVSGD